MAFAHEQVVVRRGARSGLPVVVAVHSTVLGMAVGGCRIWRYADWRDGLADALRLSEAMTFKSAVAGLDAGGGKTVVALPPDAPLGPDLRRSVLLDVGDVVESLGGVYGTGPDVGTGPDDMVTIAERTRWVFCRPASAGGSGDSSPPTAEGVLAALRALCAYLPGPDGPAGRSFAVVGLGHVGEIVARSLAAAGASLVVADVDPAKEALARSLGAAWVSPASAARAEVDVLVPAALGGLLTAALVPQLRCAAIAGPANNQLAAPSVAGLLAERGVLWLPDPLVSAGGVIYGTGRELRGQPHDEAMARVRAIGDLVTAVLASADDQRIPVSTAVDHLVTSRLTPA
jgi:leucine dehydrogenase